MNKFESVTKSLRWFVSLLLVAFVAGCGGGTSDPAAPRSSAKAITSYTVAGPVGTIPGTINESAKTVTLTVPFGTDVTARVATFTTTGASVTVGTPAFAQVSGANGTANDFTNPVVYTVHAADGTTATYTVTVTAKTVKSIAVTPGSSLIPVSATQQFMATATYNDNLTSDVTMTASWTTSTAGASVGLHTGLAAGVTASVTPVIITAALGGQQGTATLTVTAATLSSIAVTPASAVVAAGLTRQFTAMGTYSDSSTSPVTSTASWTVDSSGNASVGLHTGLATGVTTNTTPVVITATLGTKSATAALTVTPAILSSLAVSPASAVVAVGSTKQFQAIATYSDASSAVVSAGSWASASSVVATVDSNGLATGVAASASAVGITATLGGQQATAALTVNAAAGPVVCTGAGCVDLGTAANYVILTKAGVSTIPTSVVTGDIGVSPIDSTAITGFGLLPKDPTTLCFSTSPQVTGKIYAADYSSVNGCATATTDTATLLTVAVGTGNPAGMEAAYANAKLLVPAGGGDTATGGVDCPGLTGPGATAGAFGGMTITPGVYTCTVTIDIATATNVTLSGAGVYVFRTSQGITQASGTQVLLTNGALAQNVFWVPALAVTITGTAGTATKMTGVILAKTDIAVGTNATVNGRLLAQGAVTLDAATITKP